MSETWTYLAFPEKCKVWILYAITSIYIFCWDNFSYFALLVKFLLFFRQLNESSWGYPPVAFPRASMIDVQYHMPNFNEKRRLSKPRGIKEMGDWSQDGQSLYIDKVLYGAIWQNVFAVYKILLYWIIYTYFSCLEEKF